MAHHPLVQHLGGATQHIYQDHPTVRHVRFIQAGTHCHVLTNDTVYMRSVVGVSVRKTPMEIEPEGYKSSKEVVVDVYGTTMVELDDAVLKHCPDGVDMDQLVRATEMEDELVSIVNNGKSENRIDLVFMGDGYTVEERDKFLGDVRRLKDDMLDGDTFHTVLPLLNIWALFRPSHESGIGVNGIPRNTSFGLYRDGTELRGIYCSKKKAVRDVCAQLSKTGRCDFPVLLGNDDYYGGLGGEFIIGTRSPTTGTIVLRHEMGHSMAYVADEYDAGSYFGANSATDLKHVGWTHWIEKPVQEEANAIRVQDYAWYDLAKGPYRIPFVSDGGWATSMLQISVSGAETADSFHAYLDDKRLPWNTTGLLDRSFYRWRFFTALSKGNHTLAFHKSNTIPSAGHPIVQLCSVTLHEYARYYPFNPNRISAYPTYSDTGKKYLRPSDEGCLMRNMTHTKFCPVCKESLWQQLMMRIRWIDDVQVVGQTVTLHTLPVTFDGVDTDMQVQWKRNNKHVPWLDGRFEWIRDQITDLSFVESEVWSVHVTYRTNEVRRDTRRVMRDSMRFKVDK